MWVGALDQMLEIMFVSGDITVVMPDGTARRYGDQTGVPVTVRLKDTATLRHLVLSPELALGERYMNGTLEIDDDDIQSLLALIIHNRDTAKRAWWQRPFAKQSHEDSLAYCSQLMGAS